MDQRERVGEFSDCIASPAATRFYLQEIFKASREESDREEEIKAKKPSWRRSRKFYRKLSLWATDEFSFNVERKLPFDDPYFFLSSFIFFIFFSIPHLILRVSKLGINEKIRTKRTKKCVLCFRRSFYRCTSIFVNSSLECK